MAEHEQNFWSLPSAPAPNHAAEVMPNVPPPPPEVKVRTMQSDIESMMKSGGGPPRFQSVRAPNFAPAEKGHETAEVASREKKSSKTAALILIGIVALGGGAFAAYKIFFSAPAAANLPPVAHNPLPQGQTPAVSSSSAETAAPLAAHRSFFRTPPDQTLAFQKQGAAASAGDLQTVSQRIITLVKSGSPTAAFFEITAEDENGKPLSASSLFETLDAQVLDPNFLAAHFLQDITMYVYRDKNGAWPGYILGLKPGENWLYVKNDVAKLEQSPVLSNLFLNYPGDQSPAGFTDATESGQSVRALQFSGGASLYYGWLHNYLIISTSETGLTEALNRL